MAGQDGLAAAPKEAGGQAEAASEVAAAGASQGDPFDSPDFSVYAYVNRMFPTGG